ncbi:MAG: phosphopyruvate hydratase, partial [Thermoproteota archaeon]
PLLNVINGGLHAGNELSIQEFMIIPADFSAFKEAILAAAEIYHNLGDYLVSKYGISAKNVGDEGGFAPPMSKTREALDALIKAIEESGYSGKVYLGIDCAASNFYDSQTRKYRIDGKEVDAGDLIEFYVELVRDYPIMSIEDPFEEEDFLSFAELTKKIGDRVQLVGDDFFVTNQNRLKKGIEMGAGNSLLLKVNQIGTLTEALEAARIAYKAGYSVIVSHRSGETTDTAISDLAVGIGCGQIKAGAPARGERVAKYNRLLEIEEELGKRAIFAGRKALRIG